MIIYRDVISNDEFFTDASKVEKREADGVYVVSVNFVTRKEGEIALDGANPSAEELEEACEENVQSGLDVVLNHNLVESGFTKKDFMVYLKSYAKNLIEKLSEDKSAEEIDQIKKRVQSAAKFLLGKANDLQFFMGENMDPEGGMVYVEYVNDKPTMYAIIDGVIIEKC